MKWSRYFRSGIGALLLCICVNTGCPDSAPDAESDGSIRSRLDASTGRRDGDMPRSDSASGDGGVNRTDGGADRDASLPDASASPAEFRAKQVATGYSHSCAVTGAGAVYCWGANWWGQLGTEQVGHDQHPVNRPVRVELPDGISFVQVTAEQHHSCALSEGGVMYCWGLNQAGELGVGSMDAHDKPVEVDGPWSVPVTAMDAATSHTCVVTSDGEAYCWGSNFFGQLGDGIGDHGLTCPSSPVPGDCSPSPVKVVRPDGELFVAITAGATHSCALTQSGRSYCWGSDRYGSLGEGPGDPVCSVGHGTSESCSTLPLRVALPAKVALASVVAGNPHTCGHTTAGAVYCWGGVFIGEVNGSSSVIFRDTPELSSALASITFRSLTSGSSFICGIDDGGLAHCWGGAAHGGLGDGSKTFDEGDCGSFCGVKPARVIGSDYVAIASSNDHVCAILRDQRVRCWGSAESGQLGNGTDVHDTCVLSNGETSPCEPVPVAVVR